MKIRYRILSALLTGAMVCTSVPVLPASAAETVSGLENIEEMMEASEEEEAPAEEELAPMGEEETEPETPAETEPAPAEEVPEAETETPEEEAPTALEEALAGGIKEPAAEPETLTEEVQEQAAEAEALAETPILEADKTYAISGNMVNADSKSQPSMADAGILHTVKVQTDSEGNASVTLNFNGITVSGMQGYLSALRYFPTGGEGDFSQEPVEVTPVSLQKNPDGEVLTDTLGTNYMDEVTFPLIASAVPGSRDEVTYAPLQVYVPMMEEISAGTGTKNVYLKLDWSTLEEKTADDAVFEDQITIGNDGMKLQKGAKYIIPVAVKNAGNIQADSAAAACLGKYAVVTVDEAGGAVLQDDLRSVTIGTETDYATDIKVYQGTSAGGETKAAEVLKTQTAADGSGTEKTVPKEIRFEIPEGAKTQDGVYVSLYVDAMGYAPDAYVEIDYAEAKLSGDVSLNYITETGSGFVEQFGKYYVDAQVTVADGKIIDVDLSGRDFGGSYADYNQSKLNKAIDGMKKDLVGLYRNDTDKISKVDAVSGATISSNAIRAAVMSAMKLEVHEEVIADPPASLAKGTYRITMRNKTDVVDHSLVENETADAVLWVDENGKMTISYKMISGTRKEPLYVLGFNGYYTDVNAPSDGNLSKEGVVAKTENMTLSDLGAGTVVTEVQFPLTALSKFYYTNVYLYVPAMNNLNGLLSGVEFDKGKFNIRSTITLYWDTLVKTSDEIPTTPTEPTKPTDPVTPVTPTPTDPTTPTTPTTPVTPTPEPTVVTSLKKVTGAKAASSAYNKIKVSWKKVENADGYQVEQYNSSKKTWKKVATIKGTSYTRKGLTCGTKYTFRVRAYCKSGGETIYGNYSAKVSAKPVPAAASSVKVKNSSSGKAKVTWKKVSGASGYVVYRASSKNGKYKAVKTVSSKKASYTDSKLKKKKTYWYKIRSYRTVKGKKAYGSYSAAKSVKIKK